MKIRKRKFSNEEKAAIVLLHIKCKEEVSKICEELEIAPNQYYRWQKEYFENGARAFSRRSEETESRQMRKLKEEVKKLKTKLSEKNDIIAEITEDYVKLKKNFGEI